MPTLIFPPNQYRKCLVNLAIFVPIKLQVDTQIVEHNQIFDTAANFVNHTSRSVFLTGKAGTGKTTFLKYIREKTRKKSVVVAPTGVAAINAGGVTMHSLFQLPLGPFIPTTKRATDGNAVDKYSLFKDMRISNEKREIFRDLELLVIDEVSMVRADTLDALDAVLRYVRRRQHKPFGGVQVLFIGDLFQLPPVMPDGEWSLLREYYSSPFFFHSKVIQQLEPVYIELKKIYRQSDEQFISILNRVRVNEVTKEDLAILNSRFKVEQELGKKYITLTSHNYKADRINSEELRKLSNTIHEYKGVIDGEFPDRALPTDMTLQLKEGAQVMFIRNDKSNERRYYNGKLAVVSRIDEDKVFVEMNDSGEELLLEKETWDNVRYTYNTEEQEIEEEKLGSFSQYPIRLAWAITIHKSQGLTFEHAIIDAGDSFAPGQVYVALSRCVSLEGMILQSTLERKAISTHEEVLHFASLEKSAEELERTLDAEKYVYENTKLLDAFDFQEHVERTIQFASYTAQRKFLSAKSVSTQIRNLVHPLSEIQQVGVKFQQQLQLLLKERDIEKLKDRVSKAIDYFLNEFLTKIFKPLDETIESFAGEKKSNKYRKQLNSFKVEFSKKLDALQDVTLAGVSLNLQIGRRQFASVENLKSATPRLKKGESLEVTLEMLESGRSISDIATERGLAQSTIESHAVSLIKDRKVGIELVIRKERVDELAEVIKELGSYSVTEIVQHLKSSSSYFEIRAVLAHIQQVTPQVD